MNASLTTWPQAGVIYVMTHDSIGLGEDGPTHQPIEHLASFRAMPNILMIRPAAGNETAGAYKVRGTCTGSVCSGSQESCGPCDTECLCA